MWLLILINWLHLRNASNKNIKVWSLSGSLMEQLTGRCAIITEVTAQFCSGLNVSSAHNNYWEDHYFVLKVASIHSSNTSISGVHLPYIIIFVLWLLLLLLLLFLLLGALLWGLAKSIIITYYMIVGRGWSVLHIYYLRRKNSSCLWESKALIVTLYILQPCIQ